MNTKKKKKEKKKTKQLQYRAEREAVARYEAEARQLRLLQRTPPAKLMAMQQHRAFAAAASRPPRIDMRLRAAPLAVPQTDSEPSRRPKWELPCLSKQSENVGDRSISGPGGCCGTART